MEGRYYSREVDVRQKKERRRMLLDRGWGIAHADRVSRIPTKYGWDGLIGLVFGFGVVALLHCDKTHLNTTGGAPRDNVKALATCLSVPTQSRFHLLKSAQPFAERSHLAVN
jgi:hypothetical protein